MKKILDYAHSLLQSFVNQDDECIDMTIGNGNDTLFLARIAKHVYGFDIQKEAIEITQQKLKQESLSNVTLFCDSHANISNYPIKQVKAIIFNLGYLPNGDKKITTKKETTLIALKESLKKIIVGGICICVIYPGHEEGLNESLAIKEFVEKLPQKNYEVLKYEFVNQIHHPPYLLAIEKVKE